MSAQAEYFSITAGNKGFNYIEQPGIKGQGYGFETLPEKEQMTRAEIAKSNYKLTMDTRAKRKNRTDTNKEHQCIYCDISGYKQKIEHHIFTEHKEELKENICRLLNRKEIIAPYHFNDNKKGILFYFCLCCKKYWLTVGPAITHNKNCSVENQMASMLDMMPTQIIEKVADKRIVVTSEHKTQLSKENYELKKTIKGYEKAMSIEDQVSDIDNSLLITKLKKDNELLKMENQQLKAIEKPKSEKIYFETKLAIMKQTFEALIYGIAIRSCKEDYTKLDEIQELVDKTNYLASDIQTLSALKKAAFGNNIKESDLSIKLDLNKIREI
jgi:hypothetical protein